MAGPKKRKPAEIVAFAKVYAAGKVTVEASTQLANEALVSYALERATKATASIDLKRFREILREGGLNDDVIRAIASTATVVEDEIYFSPEVYRG